VQSVAGGIGQVIAIETADAHVIFASADFDFVDASGRKIDTLAFQRRGGNDQVAAKVLGLCLETCRDIDVIADRGQQRGFRR
jgi:hypothetical protein